MARTITLAPKKGKMIVFGGPYSNLEALKAMQSYCVAENIHPDQIICTGDIVAYCADPLACIKLIKDWGIHCIAGNVELNLRDESEECGCNFSEGSRCDLFSKQWYPFAKSKMTEESLEYILGLPEFIRFDYHDKKAFVLHGSINNTSEFIFGSSPKEVKMRNFVESKSDFIIAGHCGIPFNEKIDSKIWLNAGVIGMPANDANPATWFVEISHPNSEIVMEHKRLQYDYHLAAEKMKENGLPASYATSLMNGIWDNCEILPEEETKKQGLDIFL